MGVEHAVSADGHELKISILGRFDFNAKAALSVACQDLDLTGMRIIFDLRETDYIDSAALGMLLQLRERAGGDNASIELSGGQPAMLEVLRMSRCDELFVVN